MLLHALADLAKLSLFSACAYMLLVAYARHRKPSWSAPLTRRRLAVVSALTLAMSSIKLIEDVLGEETGPVDAAVLWFIRDHASVAGAGFFAAITHSGSAAFLATLATVLVVALLLARLRHEALLVATSTAIAALAIAGMKALVGRARPALWESPGSWGSSFPSGHTLATAALATAIALCVARLWPRAAGAALALAALWTALVATSRLVLGVHWPSDVLAAMCLGALVPLLVSAVLQLVEHRATRMGAPR